MTRAEAHREIEAIRPMLMGMALRSHRGNLDAASDLVQDAVLRLLKVYPQYDGRAKFSTWAGRVMLNLARSQHRRPANRVLQAFDGSEEFMACEGGIGEVEADAWREWAESVVPESYRSVVVGAALELSYEEIADSLGVNVPAVRSQLNRARAMIRKAA